MATKIEIEWILVHLDQFHPQFLLEKFNESAAGIGAALRCLYESEGAVTAGNISEFMGVSTARVAVLLKKMAARGLITKEPSADDARITVVKLTEEGWEMANQIHDEVYHNIAAIIDKVGMHRLLEFFSVAKEIHEVVKCPVFTPDKLTDK